MFLVKWFVPSVWTLVPASAVYTSANIMINIFKIGQLLFKMKSIKVKYVALAAVIILFLLYMFTDLWLLHKHKVQKSFVNLQNVVVHIDLKGSPPKLSYLMSLLPMLKNLGVTGFLTEYEDMFPYDGRLLNLSASNRYEKSELKEFLTIAIKSGFEIIPLIQTFGHMEHVLKLAEFQHLRELPFYPDSICPSRKGSENLLRDMLQQVIQFHADIAPLKHFHIGSDEVYNINKCDNCRGRKLSDMELFVNHVETVKGMVKEFSSETVILIWDDMLRGRNVSEWNRINNYSDIEPVYWDYRKKLDLSHISLLKYHSRFKEIWIASAFKGADGRIATLPNLKQRFLNHFSWMNTIRGYKLGGDAKGFNFKGIFLTGWSRYSHMDPPCELLPSSIPSLVLNLLLIKRFKEGIPRDYRFLYPDDFVSKFLLDGLNKYLHCVSTMSVEYFDNHQCSFEGNELYKIQRLIDLLNRNITIGYNDINHGLQTVDFYANSNNINRVLLGANIAWSNETYNDLLILEKRMALELSKYFDKSFVNEYVNFKTFNAKRTLHQLSKGLAKILNIHTWPRRPYHR